ncbi:MAG: AAA family ATPase [Rhizobiaceae bacterium]
MTWTPEDDGVVPVNFKPSFNQSGSKKPPTSFTTTATNKIMATKYPPIRWIVPGYLPEGFSVLAGTQKTGKTWLGIDWAIAVATGGCAMGSIECEKGSVLYIDMENGERRIQRRIETIFPHPNKRPELDRLHWASESISLDKGFIEALDQQRNIIGGLRLVIIDVLQRIKPPGSKNRNAYENDYAIFSDLQSWAMQHGIAVLALHHTRKGGADDPTEALSGSNGLSACADTTLVLKKDASGTTLYVRGRDVEEIETALCFEGGIWTMIGDASEVRRSSQRSSILSELESATAPMSPTELVAATGMKLNNLNQILYRMNKAGEVQKFSHGKYIHPHRTDLYAEPNPGKIDKKVRNSENVSARTLKKNDDLAAPQSYTKSSKAGGVRSPIRNTTGEAETELPEIPDFLRRTQH